MRLHVLVAKIMNMTVFWDIAIVALMMVAVINFETSIILRAATSQKTAIFEVHFVRAFSQYLPDDSTGVHTLLEQDGGIPDIVAGH